MGYILLKVIILSIVITLIAIFIDFFAEIIFDIKYKHVKNDFKKFILENDDFSKCKEYKNGYKELKKTNFTILISEIIIFVCGVINIDATGSEFIFLSIFLFMLLYVKFVLSIALSSKKKCGNCPKHGLIVVEAVKNDPEINFEIHQTFYKCVHCGEIFNFKD